jgi:hypothetical protein
LDIDAVRDKVMAWKSIPFLAVAEAQSDLSHAADVDMLLISIIWVVGARLGRGRREKASDVQKARYFLVLQVVHHIERRVIIMIERQNTRSR